jgi:H+/Cl- antiporter ClcA
MRCSSVDPFPTRRRVLLVLLFLLLVSGALVVFKVPRQIAQEKLSEIKARTESFAAPR